MGVQKVLYCPHDEKTRILSMLTRWYFAVKRDAKRTHIRQNKVATPQQTPYCYYQIYTRERQHFTSLTQHNVNMRIVLAITTLTALFLYIIQFFITFAFKLLSVPRPRQLL